MTTKTKKITVKENKSKGSLEMARFFVSYGRTDSEEEKRRNSYEMISLLKKENDLIMEVNTALLTFPQVNQREDYIFTLNRAIKELSLDFRYRKASASGSGNFFGDLFSFGKNKVAHELLIYVPDKVWRDENFAAILPIYGARYYICPNRPEREKLLDEIFNGQIMDDEKLDLFNPTIFDCSDFAQMGVFTKTMSLQELKNLLGV